MITAETSNNPTRLILFAQESIPGFKAQEEYPVQYYNVLPDGFEYFIFGMLATKRPTGRGILVMTFGEILPRLMIIRSIPSLCMTQTKDSP